jgi:hypothetical protein
MDTAGCIDFGTGCYIGVHIIRCIIDDRIRLHGLVIAVLHADSVHYLDERVARYVVWLVAASLLYVLVGVWGFRAIFWLKAKRSQAE